MSRSCVPSAALLGSEFGKAFKHEPGQGLECSFQLCLDSISPSLIDRNCCGLRDSFPPLVPEVSNNVFNS